MRRDKDTHTHLDSVTPRGVWILHCYSTLCPTSVEFVVLVVRIIISPSHLSERHRLSTSSRCLSSPTTTSPRGSERRGLLWSWCLLVSVHHHPIVTIHVTRVLKVRRSGSGEVARGAPEKELCLFNTRTSDPYELSHFRIEVTHVCGCFLWSGKSRGEQTSDGR